MKVKTEERDNAVIINLFGEMMLGYEANDFHEAILKAIESNKKNIVVDLSNVKFITSWGIGILVYGYTTTTNSGGKFKIVAVPEKVEQVLKTTNLDKVFDKYVTIEEALKS